MPDALTGKEQMTAPYHTRPATTSDAPRIAAMFNAASRSFCMYDAAQLDDANGLRLFRGRESSAAVQVAVTNADDIVAYHHLQADWPYLTVEAVGEIHPAHRNDQLFDRMQAWCTEQAQSWVQKAPEGVRVFLTQNVFGEDGWTRGQLARRGYVVGRRWIHLEIELHESPAPVSMPDGVTIRVLDPAHDWPAVVRALSDAFRDHWGSVRPDIALGEEPEDEPDDDGAVDSAPAPDRRWFNTPGLCFVAEADGEIVGSCLCNARTVEQPETGRVGSLSVRRAYRRRGIARALLLAAFDEFHRRGIHRVVTDTDAASFTGANHLYPAVGMKVYREEYLYVLRLRDGEDARALTPADLG